MPEKNPYEPEKPKIEMLFRTVLKNSTNFKGVLNGITAIVDIGYFTAKPEGIYLRNMDPGKVALIDFFYPKTAFDKFHLALSELRIPLKVDELLKFLRRAKKGESITLAVEDSRLGILVEGKATRNWKIPLIESDVSKVPLPTVNHGAKAKFSLPSLQEHFEDIRIVSDEVTIEALPDKITFYGEEKGIVRSGYVEVKKGSEELPLYECKKEAKSKYGLSYLLDVIKGISSISDIATLEFAEGRPIRLSFDLLHGIFTFYLAPRPI